MLSQFLLFEPKYLLKAVTAVSFPDVLRSRNTPMSGTLDYQT